MKLTLLIIKDNLQRAKMGEMVQINIGGSASKIAIDFWDILARQHGIQYDGLLSNDLNNQQKLTKLQRVSSYFSENQSGHYFPRAIMADLDPSSSNDVMCSKMSNLFELQNMCYLNQSARNNFSIAYHSEGKKLLPEVEESIRKEIEACDFLQGFQFVSSTNGGTGSGFGPLLYQSIHDSYPKNICFSVCLVPSPSIAYNTLETYNSVFFLGKQSLQMPCILIDNGALFRICEKKKKIKNPIFSDINHIIANAMSDISSTQRFCGEMNASYRKMMTNLMPFSTLKFLSVCYSPFEKNNDTYANNVKNMLIRDHRGWLNQLHSFSTQMSQQHLLSSFMIFRGNHNMYEIDNNMGIMSKFRRGFRIYQNMFVYDYQIKKVKWLNQNYSTTLVRQSNLQEQKSIVSLNNKVSIRQKLSQIRDKYVMLRNKKLYMHLFMEEGTEQMQLQEGYHGLNDIIADYQSCLDVQGGQQQEWVFEE